MATFPSQQVAASQRFVAPIKNFMLVTSVLIFRICKTPILCMLCIEISPNSFAIARYFSLSSIVAQVILGQEPLRDLLFESK